MDYKTYNRLCVQNIGFSYECKACRLAHSDQKKNPPIPGGIDYTRKKKLRLVVVSDHPGAYEEKAWYVMYDNTPEHDRDKNRKKAKNPPRRPNAGKILREFLERDLGLDSYGEVYITNAVKCNPGKKTVEIKHIIHCRKQWFDKELELIEKINPTVPFLFLGTNAFSLLKLMIPQLAKSKYNTLNAARRQVLYYQQHPVVCTFNPASVAKSKLLIEKEPVDKTPITVAFNDYLVLPELPTSPISIYRADLLTLKPFFSGQ